MKSTVIKRSVVIDGCKTSISIEDAFWDSLKEISNDKGVTLSRLVSSIKSSRSSNSNLSSAIRVFILSELRTRLNALLAGGSRAAERTAPAGAPVELPPADNR